MIGIILFKYPIKQPGKHGHVSGMPSVKLTSVEVGFTDHLSDHAPECDQKWIALGFPRHGTHMKHKTNFPTSSCPNCKMQNELSSQHLSFVDSVDFQSALLLFQLVKCITCFANLTAKVRRSWSSSAMEIPR